MFQCQNETTIDDVHNHQIIIKQGATISDHQRQSQIIAGIYHQMMMQNIPNNKRKIHHFMIELDLVLDHIIVECQKKTIAAKEVIHHQIEKIR